MSRAYGAIVDFFRQTIASRGIELETRSPRSPSGWACLFAAASHFDQHPEILERAFACTRPTWPKAAAQGWPDNSKISTQWTAAHGRHETGLKLKVTEKRVRGTHRPADNLARGFASG